jgi:hypothetical protein
MGRFGRLCKGKAGQMGEIAVARPAGPAIAAKPLKH